MDFRGFILGLLILSISASSCTFDPIEEQDCWNDDDCPGSQVCRVGICGGEESEPRKLGFTLIPPESSSLPIQTIASTKIKIDSAIQLLFNPGARIMGQIRFIDSTISPTGSLTFSNKDTSFSAQIRAEKGEYSIIVPAGSYRITFVPDDPSIPSKVWKKLKFERDTDPKLTIPAPEYTPVTGTLSFIHSGQSRSKRAESNFIKDARIFAVSRETGALSTIATTNEDGTFEIRVLPNSGAYDLRVVSTEMNALIPDTTFDNFFISTEKGWKSTIRDDIATLSVSLGEYKLPERYTDLQLTADGKNQSWEQFDVLISFPAGKGKITLRPEIEKDGHFQAPLLENTKAKFTIVAPPQSPLTSITFSRPLENKDVIKCPPKHRLFGKIQDLKGKSIAARLEALRLDGSGTKILTTTNEKGEYSLGLEAHKYLISVIPQDSSIARVLFRADGNSSKETTEKIVEVLEPTLIWGTVFNHSGESLLALEGVTIQAYEELDGERLKIGEARSDDKGTFKLIIPAQKKNN